MAQNIFFQMVSIQCAQHLTFKNTGVQHPNNCLFINQKIKNYDLYSSTNKRAIGFTKIKDAIKRRSIKTE